MRSEGPYCESIPDAETNSRPPDHQVISLAPIDDKRGWSIYPKSYRTL